MAFSIFKSFLPATSPNIETNIDTEMTTLEPPGRTANTSESMSRPPATNPEVGTNLDTEMTSEPRSRAASTSESMSGPPAIDVETNFDAEMTSEPCLRTASTSTSRPPATNPNAVETNPDTEMTTEPNSRTASASKSIARPPAGEQWHPLIEPSLPQIQHPASSGESSRTLPQATRIFAHFGQTDFGVRPIASTSQQTPESRIHGKKRSRPEDDDPAKVRVVRHVSPGGQASITAKISQEFGQKHAELEEKQKVVQARLEEERVMMEQQRTKLDKEWAKLEERQKLAERIAREEEARRTGEQTRREAEEAKLAAALRRVEDVEKEAEKSRNEATEQIRVLKEESTKMARMMQLLMEKTTKGSVTEEIATRLPAEVRAEDEIDPMDLYVENLALPGPSKRRDKGKTPIRGGEYDGDDDEEDDQIFGDKDRDKDMAMERAVSETPGPSEFDNEHGRIATTVVQDMPNVPPPRQFPSPRGGGRSAAMDVQMTTLNPTSQRPSTHPTEVTRFRTRTNQSWTNGLATYYGQDAIPDVDTSGAPRKRTKPMAAVFHKTALKGFDPVGATRKTGVRRAMNELLGINKDVDIIEKEFALEEEVYRYRDEQIGDPALYPMRPYFLKGGFNTWNDRLCEKFVDHYEDKLGIRFTDAQKLDAESHFVGRINRLGQLWRKARTKEQTLRIAEEKKLERARKNCRRMTLYDDRREICVGNLTNPDGTVHEAWKTLYGMLEKMGPAGMSSDESEAEEKHTVYIVRRKPWRSEEVHQMLMFIDKDRNTTGVTGGARPGNPPRKRKRPLNRQTTSKRDPSLGCPINYYDKIFYAGLNNREIRALDAQPEETLPVIVRTS